MIGASISKVTGIPWIADLRDLWSQYHMYDYGKVRLKLDQWLERRTLNRTSAIVVVSSIRANQLKKLFNKKRIETVTLGYDPDDFLNDKTTQPKNVLVITHVGKLLRKANAEPFFQALSELFTEKVIQKGCIEAHFWGSVEQKQKDLSKSLGLDGVVIFHNRISRHDVIQYELRSHILLLCTWSDPEQTGVHPGKLFDYLGARRPILAVGKHRDVVTKLLEETKAGVHLSTVTQIKLYLTQVYMEFKKSGTIIYKGDELTLSQYSYQIIARKYAKIMNTLV
jgi:glycosyltransferase involved in cell wall biosynthesis